MGVGLAEGGGPAIDAGDNGGGEILWQGGRWAEGWPEVGKDEGVGYGDGQKERKEDVHGGEIWIVERDRE